ncbi:hypothetical protein F4780DRAFT_784294 [Xylariomycetidae sp. FL0641]|nr:hypothetical protein F4780DRAFT_784294 [Xylariomycetidae sp. FL0641]
MNAPPTPSADLVGVRPPPPGVIPNFDHPQSDWWRFHLTGLIICLALATLFFVVRCYSRFVLGPKILLEDVTCTIAWILLVLYIWTVFMMIHYGEGFHAWEVTVDSYSEILKWLYASSVLYCPAAYITKATLLLMIVRVFAVRVKVVRALKAFSTLCTSASPPEFPNSSTMSIRCLQEAPTHVQVLEGFYNQVTDRPSVVIVLLFYIPIQGIKTFICTPIRAYWIADLPGGHCLAQRKIFLSDMALAIVTDFTVLFVPIPLTWSLNMSLRKKLKIMALLSAGGAATGVTLFRLVKVAEFIHSTDVTHDFAVIDLMTTIEVTIGLICACLPSANILAEKMWHERKKGRLGSSNRDPNTPRTSSSKSSRARRYQEWWSSHVTARTVTTTTKSEAQGDTITSPDPAAATAAAAGVAVVCECGGGIGTATTMFGDDFPARFDVEQQMLSGQPIDLGKAGSGGGGGGCCSCPRHPSTGSDGMESSVGMLAAAMTETSEFLHPAVPDARGIRRTVEISLDTRRLEGDSGIRRPDKIWDGSWDDPVTLEHPKLPE